MNNFDEKQIKLLEPLLDNDVVLHFSFYANTFPIAYHYNLLLKNSNNYQLLKLHDWSEIFPSKSNEFEYNARVNTLKEKWIQPHNINIFYAAQIKYSNSDFKNPFEEISNELKKFKKYEKIKYANFTSYIPRFVFLNNNLYTKKLLSSLHFKENLIDFNSSNFSEYNNIKENYINLDSVVNEIITDGITSLNIYTDTLNEAKDILEEYSTYFKTVNYYDKNNISSIGINKESRNDSNSLDIYYYGAPTSFHFLKRKERFFPVLLNPEKLKNGITTMFCIHYNTKVDATTIEKIENSLNEYHKNLFDTAILENGAECLNNVRLAYNKYARLIRHDSYFHKPQSFANCIALYNVYNPVEDNNKQEKNRLNNVVKTTSYPPKIHVHYGAGKLGIGLVIPLIKYEENNTQLIIIQKRKDDWRKLQKNKSISTKVTTTIGTIETERKYYFKQQIQDNSKDINEIEDYIYLFDKLSEVKDILEKADSISYSLGNKFVEEEFLEFINSEKINFIREEVLIFPFENNPFGVKNSTRSERESKLTKTKLIDIPVKADRICFNREFNSDNEISVKAENYLEVVLGISKEKNRGLFNPSLTKDKLLIFVDITEKEGKERYEFLSQRKKLLVNELHFILAIYGYDFLINKKVFHWDNQYITIIQSALFSESEYRKPIDTFINLQIIRILLSKEFENSVIQKEYQLVEFDEELLCEKLLSYAEIVKKRFSESEEDQVSRVFNSLDIDLVKLKYEGIIKTIEIFLKENKSDIEEKQISRIGTYLEYQSLIEDIKKRIRYIAEANTENIKKELEKLEKLKIDRAKQSENYETEIEKLIN